MSDPGLLSIQFDKKFYTLYLPERGWLAIEFLGFLDDVLESPEPAGQILKLLGFTMHMDRTRPPRQTPHWVFVHLAERLVETNSPLLRSIVDEEPPSGDDPMTEMARRRVYEVLDRYNFTVKLFKSGGR